MSTQWGKVTRDVGARAVDRTDVAALRTVCVPAARTLGGLRNLRVAPLAVEIWAEPLGGVAKRRCEFQPLCNFL